MSVCVLYIIFVLNLSFISVTAALFLQMLILYPVIAMKIVIKVVDGKQSSIKISPVRNS